MPPIVTFLRLLGVSLRERYADMTSLFFLTFGDVYGKQKKTVGIEITDDHQQIEPVSQNVDFKETSC